MERVGNINLFGENYKIIKDLRDTGKLKKLMNAGLISWKIMLYFDITTHYDILMKMGYGKMDAMVICSEKFGDGNNSLGDNTIYRALISMQYDYRSINPHERKGKRFLCRERTSNDIRTISTAAVNRNC